nr:YqaA family protein [methane-oxidizing endosymbiont of Gigantopelta aegis]
MELESFTLTGLFISAFISSTIAPGGSEAVLAYMVSNTPDILFSLIAIATLGNTLGALTTWWLGAFATKKFPPDKIFSANKQKSIALVKKWGGWALLFSWLPVIGDGLCFAGGWLRLSFIPALLAILIGKALRYWLVAYSVSQFV